MQINAASLWLPKSGNQNSEYEDAFWPAHPGMRDGTQFRFAVADGATETSFSGVWARQLARSFGTGRLHLESIETVMAVEQSRWQDFVRSKTLPWYAEEKALQGAFSALLGLTLAETTDGDGSVIRWHALSCGDCCLAHVRSDLLLTTFPATDAEFFTHRPYLLSSHPARNERLPERLQSASGEAQPGDLFALMTDALAHWFVATAAAGSKPWQTLAACTGQHDRRRFAALVDELRSSDQLRNDDVTLTWLELT